MADIKKFLIGVGWFLARVFVYAGAVLISLAEFGEQIFGPGVMIDYLQDNGTGLGLVLFAIGGAALLLRIEWRIRQSDSLFGNEHMLGLVRDGIPPNRFEYLRQVQQGNYPIVQRFWAAGMVNVDDAGNRPDLHCAAEFGHAAIVEGILERGGNPKGQNSEGATPLIAAAVKGNTNVIEVLLKHDCAINAKLTNGGNTALFTAATYGHTRAIKLLFDNGAELDALDNNNLTPLMGAMAQHQWDAVKTLIDLGSDLQRKDAYGATLMDYAIALRAPTEIKDRLKKAKIKESEPRIIKTGGGFSRFGKVTVRWDKAENQR